MNQHDFEQRPSSDSHENEHVSFMDKFAELLPGVEFDESNEMLEARTAVLEALNGSNQDPDFLRSIWIEYAKICEQTVDSLTSAATHPLVRLKMQIAVQVHKALIFREAGDRRSYGINLAEAEDYAYTKYLDEIADAIGAELDSLRA